MRRNEVHSETTRRINISTILSWSKMWRRRSRLDSSMNFAWLRIHEERIPQIIFTMIAFQARVSRKHNSRREMWSPLGQTEVNADEQRGFVWDSGVRLLGQRFDKQCQRPSENPVIHGSAGIIQGRLALSVGSADTALWRQTVRLSSERRSRLTRLSVGFVVKLTYL